MQKWWIRCVMESADVDYHYSKSQNAFLFKIRMYATISSDFSTVGNDHWMPFHFQFAIAYSLKRFEWVLNRRFSFILDFICYSLCCIIIHFKCSWFVVHLSRVLNWLARFSIIAENIEFSGFDNCACNQNSKSLKWEWHEYCEPFDAKTTKHLSPRVFVDSFEALFPFHPPFDSVDCWHSHIFPYLKFQRLCCKVLKIYSVFHSLHRCSEIQQDDTCNVSNETKTACDCGCISFKCATSEGTRKKTAFNHSNE